MEGDVSSRKKWEALGVPPTTGPVLPNPYEHPCYHDIKPQAEVSVRSDFTTAALPPPSKSLSYYSPGLKSQAPIQPALQRGTGTSDSTPVAESRATNASEVSSPDVHSTQDAESEGDADESAKPVVDDLPVTSETPTFLDNIYTSQPELVYPTTEAALQMPDATHYISFGPESRSAWVSKDERIARKEAIPPPSSGRVRNDTAEKKMQSVPRGIGPEKKSFWKKLRSIF